MFIVYLWNEGVYSSKNKVTPQIPKRIKIFYGRDLTNREALTVLCSVIKHAGSG